MAQASGTRPKLSFDRASAICRELIPIADHGFDYLNRLCKAGFAAFMPRNEFIESFAGSPEELEIHRRCVVETAKERLGQPITIRKTEDERKQLYFSLFLQRLREERDKENGVPERELSGESAWR
jgi:hypothetical protein